MTHIHIHVHKARDSRKRVADMALDREDVGRTAWFRNGSKYGRSGKILEVDEQGKKARCRIVTKTGSSAEWVPFSEIESV